MEDNPEQRKAEVRRALNPKQGSWDGARFWPISPGLFLAYVSDAPVDASQECTSLIEEVLVDEIQNIRRASFPSLLPVILADVVTVVSERLHRNARATYAAAAFVLVASDVMHAIVIGDCSIWISYALGETPASLVRLSDTTRVNGRTAIPPTSFSTGLTRTTHGEASQPRYLGAPHRAFNASEVLCLPTLGMGLLVLCSDGVEDQIGIEQFYNLVRRAKGPAALVSAYSLLIAEQEVIDDITLLALRVDGNPAALQDALNRIDQIQTHISDYSQHLHGLQQWMGAVERRIGVTEGSSKALEANYSTVFDQLRIMRSLVDGLDAKHRERTDVLMRQVSNPPALESIRGDLMILKNGLADFGTQLHSLINDSIYDLRCRISDLERRPAPDNFQPALTHRASDEPLPEKKTAKRRRVMPRWKSTLMRMTVENWMLLVIVIGSIVIGIGVFYFAASESFPHPPQGKKANGSGKNPRDPNRHPAASPVPVPTSSNDEH